jgi:two-component SAPR family response regulator
MLPTTIILCDKNTQQMQSVIKAVQGYFNVLCTASHDIPDISRKNAAAFIILCLKPDKDVLDYIRHIQFVFPTLPILVMSPSPQPAEITTVIQLGAKGYFNLLFEDDTLLKWLKEHTAPTEKGIWVWLKKVLFNAPTLPQRVELTSNIALPMMDIVTHAVSAMTATDTAPDASNTITVSFFGSLGIDINKQPLPIRGSMNGLLLAYILFQYPRPVHRQRLIEKFWPNSTSDAARNCLNATIHALRKAFNECVGVTPILIFQNEHYAIHHDWTVQSDVQNFKFLRDKALDIERTQGLRVALPDYLHIKEVYKDDFLINYPNHEWVLGMRDNFREKYIQMLIHLGAFYQKEQKYVDAIEQYKSILSIDDAIELAHRGLMESFYALKMKDEGIKQYGRSVQSVRRLNMTLSKETNLVYNQLCEL